MPVERFHPLLPGTRLPGDWYDGAVPSNIEVGDNSVIDSAYAFRHFYSTLSVGLRIGRDVTIWRAGLAVEPHGYLEIGDQCYIANASLVVSERVTVGSGVFIAGGVTIADSDFHPLEPAARLADTIALSPVGDRSTRPAMQTRPVWIDDDVWIGYNAVILKGVHIGCGAVIAPGAVVIRDVPAGAEVVGNPAVQTLRS